MPEVTRYGRADMQESGETGRLARRPVYQLGGRRRKGISDCTSADGPWRRRGSALHASPAGGRQV